MSSGVIVAPALAMGSYKKVALSFLAPIPIWKTFEAIEGNAAFVAPNVVCQLYLQHWNVSGIGSKPITRTAGRRGITDDEEVVLVLLLLVVVLAFAGEDATTADFRAVDAERRFADAVRRWRTALSSSCCC